MAWALNVLLGVLAVGLAGVAVVALAARLVAGVSRACRLAVETALGTYLAQALPPRADAPVPLAPAAHVGAPPSVWEDQPTAWPLPTLPRLGLAGGWGSGWRRLAARDSEEGRQTMPVNPREEPERLPLSVAGVVALYARPLGAHSVAQYAAALAWQAHVIQARHSDAHAWVWVPTAQVVAVRALAAAKYGLTTERVALAWRPHETKIIAWRHSTPARP